MQTSKRVEGLRLSPLQAFFRKAREMQGEGKSVISFAVGDPNFQTPAYVKKAGIRAIEEGHTKYTPAGGLAKLRAMAAVDFEKSGIYATSDNTIVSAGSQPLIASAILALCDEGECDEGDELLIPSPYYPPYVAVAEVLGIKPVFVDTALDGFVLKRDRVEKYLSERSKFLLINSPNNPTGMVWDTDELGKLAELDLAFIVDEAYARLVYGIDYVSLGSFPEMAERTVTVRSASKSWSMSGWRIGWLTGPKNVVEKIEIWLEAFLVSPCAISQEAVTVALEHSPEPYMLWELDQRRRCLIQWLEKRGIDYPLPHGAFYAFPALPRMVDMSSTELAEFLLEKAGVVVTPGIAFGCDDRIRISYAPVSSLPELKEGLERIDKALGLDKEA